MNLEQRIERIEALLGLSEGFPVSRPPRPNSGSQPPKPDSEEFRNMAAGRIVPEKPNFVWAYGIRAIARNVCAEMGVDFEMMLGEARLPAACRARWATIWLARTNLLRSYPQIGSVVNLDHSTVIYGFRRAEELVISDLDFRQAVSAVQSKLFGKALP